jgi:enoyl-CoA hydratase/carnithine racemase
MGGKDTSPEAMAERERMYVLGARLVLRIYAFPKPVVMAATGHGLALGAILLMAGDVRVGPAPPLPPRPPYLSTSLPESSGSGSTQHKKPKKKRKEAKFGMNEVAIGMTVPDYALALARARLLPGEVTQCVTMAKICGAEEAQRIGYLDVVVSGEEEDGVLGAAMEEAARLGKYVKRERERGGRRLDTGREKEMERWSERDGERVHAACAVCVCVLCVSWMSKICKEI